MCVIQISIYFSCFPRGGGGGQGGGGGNYISFEKNYNIPWIGKYLDKKGAQNVKINIVIKS